MAKNIRQQVRLKASPKDVYNALVDPKLHARFTGMRVTNEMQVGGKFTAFAGQIEGRNVELVQGRRVVQAWRAKSWPAGAWSIARFNLEAVPGGKTLLTFVQSGVPNDAAAEIRKGWPAMYWKPLRKWIHEGGFNGAKAAAKAKPKKAKAKKTAGKKAKAKKATRQAAGKKKAAKKAAGKKKAAKKAAGKKKAAKKATRQAAGKKKAAKKAASKKKAAPKRKTAKKK